MVFATLSSKPWYYIHDGTNWNNIHRGPFRYSTGTYNAYSQPVSWEPVDTFSWITDGLTNQFLIGEKHIPIGFVGKCSEVGSSTSEGLVTTGDCSILATNMTMAAPSGRAFVYYENASTTTITAGLTEAGIARPRDLADIPATRDAARTVTRMYGFGSWHAGVGNFLMGDGSVRGLAVTTPPRMLRYLSVVNDGETVTLP